jgi:hypothetical protein
VEGKLGFTRLLDVVRVQSELLHWTSWERERESLRGKPDWERVRLGGKGRLEKRVKLGVKSDWERESKNRREVRLERK